MKINIENHVEYVLSKLVMPFHQLHKSCLMGFQPTACNLFWLLEMCLY